MSETNITLYTPHEHQIPIHDACSSDETFFVTIIAGRQSGKSIMLINQALIWVINNPGVLVYWVSKNNTQAIRIYKMIINAIIESGTIKSNKEGKGDCEIIFKNGSIIKFRSGESGDNLRGESVEYLLLDEAAFIKETTWNEVLLPMLNNSGLKCIISTTPKGKNWVYYRYLDGLKGNPRHKSFKFTSYDNPHRKIGLVEEAKLIVPDVVFRQEWMAEFIDAAAIFENIDGLAVIKMYKKPIDGEKYYGGIDIGMKQDSTVITIMNQNCEVVFYDRFSNISGPDLKQRLIKTLDLFKPVKTYIELNNQGLPIYDDLIKIHKVKHLKGFDTTSISKPEIINNLINTFASKKIKILKDEYFKEELRAYEITFPKNSTGRPKFGAPSGFHDDCVMSLAICYRCFTKSRFSGTYQFA